MRYAYIKHGDAVDQVRRLSSCRDFDRSGPDAFIGDFLRAHANDEIFIACRADHAERFQSGHVMAVSFPGDRAHHGGTIRRILSTLRIGAAILSWRPHRILCGCTGELLWISVLAAKLLRVQIVNSRHGELQERSSLASIITFFDRACIRACDAVVCHGPFMTDQILEIGVPKSRVFQFEVELSLFARRDEAAVIPAPVREFAQGKRRLVTFIGRVQRDKGVFDLLKAFCAAGPSERKLGLIYAGDGRDAVQLEEQSRECGASEDVLLLGKVPHKDLAQLLRLSSVVVTPTRPEFPEGRCMAVLESLVLGVPVIAPRSGPFPYAVRHGVNGLLFEPGDADSLRECLSRIADADDTLERLREGAHKTSAELLKAQRSFAEAVHAAFNSDVKLTPVIKRAETWLERQRTRLSRRGMVQSGSPNKK
jgi:glycosyltransferase involved in cell wall biosynthesis